MPVCLFMLLPSLVPAGEIIAPDGTVLGSRKLLHPHVNKQPFERSLEGVKIAAGTQRVTVRAHDSVHGYGGHHTDD